MQAPITINDSSTIDVPGDVRVYGTIEAAESSLEIYDAADESIHVIDAKGMLLRIIPDGKTGGARLTPAEATPSKREELTRLLQAHLVAAGLHQTAVVGMSLEDLTLNAYRKNPDPYSA